MKDQNVHRISQSAEAEFMYQYVSMAPPSARSKLGIDTTRIGGGVVLSVRNDVTGYWSKALGAMTTEPTPPATTACCSMVLLSTH